MHSFISGTIYVEESNTLYPPQRTSLIHELTPNPASPMYIHGKVWLVQPIFTLDASLQLPGPKTVTPSSPPPHRLCFKIFTTSRYTQKCRTLSTSHFPWIHCDHFLYTTSFHSNNSQSPKATRKSEDTSSESLAAPSATN